MTNDELVKFAVGKVGVELNGSCFLENEITGMYKPFDLSSPDLMLKGMVVLLSEQDVCIKIDREEVDIYNYVTEAYALRKRNGIDDISTLFWQCWAELEG